MAKTYLPTFLRLCRKLSVYVTQHEHVMLDTLEKIEYSSEEEKRQLREFFKQLKDMSVVFHKVDKDFRRFDYEEEMRRRTQRQSNRPQPKTGDKE